MRLDFILAGLERVIAQIGFRNEPEYAAVGNDLVALQIAGNLLMPAPLRTMKFLFASKGPGFSYSCMA